MIPQLNKGPHTHFVLGFAFHIMFEGKEGIDQHGIRWINKAEYENSFLPEPVDPSYLNVFMDAFNKYQEVSRISK